MTSVNAVLLLMSVGLWSRIWAGPRRVFILQSEAVLNWTEAARLCRDQGLDLATILDPEQNSDAAATFSISGGKAFIGLSRVWSWSLDNETEPVDMEWVLPWADNEPQNQSCTVLQTKTKDLVTANCGDLKDYTACYRDSDQRHFVVKGTRTWMEARDLCRSNYTDLSTVQDQNQIEKLLQVFHGQTPASNLLQGGSTTSSTPTATHTTSPTSTTSSPDSAQIWIGLNRRRWLWSDLAPVSWSNWDLTPDSGHGCVVIDRSGNWAQEDCFHDNKVICYEDVPELMRKTVKLHLNPGSADLSDPVIQQSLLNQVTQRLEGGGVTGARLTWSQCKKQPSKTAPSTGCDKHVLD